MKKGIIKALGITALVAVGAVGGMALGAEIANGFETTYSESAYEDYGDKKQQIGYEQGKQEGLEEGFENGQQIGHEAGYQEGQQVGYENGYTAGEEAGFDSGFEAGQTYRDPEKTYLEDIINGVEVNVYEMDSGLTFLSSTSSSFPGIYKLNADGSVEQVYNDGYGWDIFNELSNGNVLISSKSNSNDGLYLYILESNSLIELVCEEFTWKWNFYHELPNGNVLTGPNITGGGLYLFDSQSYELIKIFDGGSGYNIFNDLDDGSVFISASNNSKAGLLLYKISSNTVSLVIEESYYWKYVYEIENTYAFVSSFNDNTGLYLYDFSVNKAKKIYDSGYKWDTFVEDENGVTISSSVNVDQGKVYYDFETGTVTPIEEGDESQVI